MTPLHIARDFVGVLVVATPFAVADIAKLLKWVTRS